VRQTFSQSLFFDPPDRWSAGGAVENGILDTGYENAKGVSNEKGVQGIAGPGYFCGNGETDASKIMPIWSGG